MENNQTQSVSNNKFSFVTAHKKRSLFFLLLILVLGYFIYSHYSTTAASTTYVLGKVTKQTLIISVSGTGQVSQDRTVNITPQSSGKLTSVSVKQGDKVKAGQAIAVVDETANLQSLNQAKASVASAQANYDQTLAGSTSQDVQLSQLSVDSAQAALDQAKKNLDTVTTQQTQAVQNAQTAMLNAGLAAVPSNSNSGSGTITLSGTYSDTKTGSYTITIYSTGSGQYYTLGGLETDEKQIYKNIPETFGTKGLYVTFAGSFANGDIWTVNIPNQQSNSYTSATNAYQSAQTSQAAALQTAQNQITSAQNNLQQAQINLQVKQQPPTNQQVESAKATLTSANAQLANAELAYNNNVLTAPFDGNIAAVNNQVGDQVSQSTNVATEVSNQTISTIPLNENDVAKVAVGDKASMTFDAIDGLSISGKVVQIDQLGTVSQGVVTYNVKIAFDTEDARVKPGMSVNASIITQVVPDALVVPISAVQSQGSGSYLLELDPNQTQTVTGQTGVTSKVAPTTVTVQTGVSDDTYTQITSGANEGDNIVVQKITVTATKSAASSATSALRLGGGGGGFGGGATGATRPAGGATATGR